MISADNSGETGKGVDRTVNLWFDDWVTRVKALRCARFLRGNVLVRQRIASFRGSIIFCKGGGVTMRSEFVFALFTSGIPSVERQD